MHVIVGVSFKFLTSGAFVFNRVIMEGYKQLESRPSDLYGQVVGLFQLHALEFVAS